VCSSPNALELYGPPQEMRIVLRKDEMIFETIPEPLTRSFSFRMSKSMHSTRGLSSSSQHLAPRYVMSSNSMHSRRSLGPRNSSPRRCMSDEIKYLEGGNEVKKQRVSVGDIIICELFEKSIKITFISSGIFSLTGVSDLHRELLISFLSNILPDERLREFTTNAEISQPYISRQGSMCSFDTATCGGDSISLTMDQFAGKKMKNACNNEVKSAYVQRKVSLWGSNLSSIFERCSCFESICGNTNHVDDDTDSSGKVLVNSIISYEEETVVTNASAETQRKTDNLSPFKTPGENSLIDNDEEEGDFVNDSLPKVPSLDDTSNNQ